MFSNALKALRPKRRSLGKNFRQSNDRYHGLRLEPLEDRRMLSLLGIAPQLQLPLMTYDSTGTTQYTEASDAFDINATPLFYVDPVYGPSFVTGASGFDINITVDDAGNLAGTSTSTDLVVTGDVDVNNDSVIDYSGTLLTGKILEFGHEDSGGPTDQYDFRFQVTGGALAGSFVGKDLGVTTTSEGSSFTGDFTVDFGGGAKGNLGAIEPLVVQASSIAGHVYLDANDDGVMDTGETGIEGVTVHLTGVDDQGNPVDLTTTTDVDGYYEFLDLDPGTYTLTEEDPAGYADGTDTAGSEGGTALNDVIENISLGSGVDAVDYLFGEVDAADIEGLVWHDTDDNGIVNLGESVIEGVTVTLTGSNDRGESVSLVTTTDADGVYFFTDLRPSDATGYTVTETQPAGYDDGQDIVGTVDGILVGYVPVNDVFAGIVLDLGSYGENYNFGETGGDYVAPGQTATIGYWQNKNGQNLIKSLNGGSTSTDLGNWLAATLPNLYGADAGVNDLTGKTNAEVASFYKSIFKMKKKDRLPGPTKLDPQAMAVAFAVYVTNESLAGTVAQSYGFNTSAEGVGAALFDIDAAVGAGTATTLFGANASTVMEVLTILQLTDGNSTDGIIYDDGDGEISSYEKMLRTLVNELFTAINEGGDI